MERFDPNQRTLEINGQIFTVNAIEFERVMGIKDGGRPIETCGRSSDISKLRILFNRDSRSLPRACIKRLVFEGIDGGQMF